ncbi:response regulator [Desulfocastanea catecholica]
MRPPESFTIVVTDSNHHVCDLLQRELEKEGYAVHSLKSANKAYEYLCSSSRMDLLILDPQLFHPFDQTIIDKILRHHAATQIIFHSYTDILSGLKTADNISQIEKNAASISSVKSVAHALFQAFAEK